MVAGKIGVRFLASCIRELPGDIVLFHHEFFFLCYDSWKIWFSSFAARKMVFLFILLEACIG